MSLYTVFENISLNVAKTFENQIDDKSQWHSVLLRRMTLEIEGIRPCLYSLETYQCLDELRRFRHFFAMLILYPLIQFGFV
ncbi:ribonuclease toxin HepT-like protein [Leptodesmis sichuanensis]|uniref:ribonuclease toxin HepT-like protein n=1 Tax=Leptodesmis sichuanensis TaxID=2906798 RepID=UPI0036F3147A